MSDYPRLRFKGEDYILINSDNNRYEGAITTEELYDRFELNPYHLLENGDIMRFGEVVGNIKDIEWLN